ncbi:hypothetical protein BOS5A_230219 [Bosea sp. EC-HK365B]|nr:hypothetical protein BOSE21B_90297 [Bosea sp. 21B]CAD5298395.1 hypothetical protein BOSE7B_60368 [Bosea sp. 7B]VVT60942.1 hypothetical protein BOS5A_230219 [Bosea sp. EC-HK365B]VXB35470.1 hypothetical protein BOSE127_110367 [Bosea sp. 127]
MRILLAWAPDIIRAWSSLRFCSLAPTHLQVSPPHSNS